MLPGDGALSRLRPRLSDTGDRSLPWPGGPKVLYLGHRLLGI